mgnify:FL=1
MDKKKIKEFFADKKNRRFAGLSALTFLGLIGALALQTVWLINTYQLIQANIRKESYETIEKALEEEGNMRFGQTPKGTKIMSGPTNDTIPPMTYFYQRLNDMGYPMSLHNLDSITNELLVNKDLGNRYYIYLINLQTGERLDSIGTHQEMSWLSIKPKYFPIRSDYTQVIQLILTNPFQTFLERMGLLILATIIILILVVSSIIYQIRIIARMNKIFQIREDFTYAMIHDMKTPLSSIFTALYFLHSGRLDNKPETKEKYYTIAENEVDHLLTLTNKVLTLSKLESHKLEMNREDVPLEPMVENLTVKFTAKAQKPVRFTADLKAPAVYADKEYLEEILSNLIDNAIKYSKPEGVDIRIRSELNEKYTVVKVHDNGLGISEADQRTIFNKYERAAAGRKKNKNRPSGFGLGLNFVQQVMHAHEGKVFVSSIEGEFTEFALLFPR